MRHRCSVFGVAALAAAVVSITSDRTAFADSPPAPDSSAAPAPESIARAEGLFREAQVLLEAGKVAEACPRFAESQKLAPGLGVSLYLADCWERTGRVFSAQAEFKRAEATAAARKDPRAAIAHARAAALDASIPTMTIRVPTDTREAGLEIRRDEHVLTEAEWDASVPLDPGNHVIRMAAPNRKTREIAILVKASDKSVVTLLPLENPSAPVVATVAPVTSVSTPATTPIQPSSDTTPKSGATQRWIGVGLGGAGVVLVGVGAVLGLSAKSKLDSSNESGRCNAADQCTAEGLGLRSDASGLATGSTVLVALGGAAVVGGVVLFLTAPKGSAASSSSANGATTLTLKPGPGRAELTLGGRF